MMMVIDDGVPLGKATRQDAKSIMAKWSGMCSLNGCQTQPQQGKQIAGSRHGNFRYDGESYVAPAGSLTQ